jgi:anti-sigma regulatory factor (Ser/Thr protein kinase)
VLGGFGVAHSPVSAALARQRLSSLLAAQSLDPEWIDDVALVVSELVGNAVRHAQGLPSGGLHVDWEIRPGVVELAVTDGGSPTEPRVRNVDVDAQGGRGLAIVEALAADWGVRAQGEVRTVWAEVRHRRPLAGHASSSGRMSSTG